MKALDDHSLEFEQILLLALYGVSTIASLELIAIFTRVRKNITLRIFSTVYVCFAACVFVGMGVSHGDVRTLGAQSCRAQAVLMLYLLSLLYALNFFLTFNVWSAVCGKKFRDQERRRFPIYLSVSVIVALIPAVVVAILNSQKPSVGLMPGFGPHSVYCTYMYPINSYSYGVFPYNALLIISTLCMILHASFRLMRYRSLLSATARGGSSSHNVKSSGSRRQSSGGSANSTISLAMCYRFGSWGVVFLAIAVCANIGQSRAMVAGHYVREDLNIGVREYAGSVVGLAFWIVFGTGKAAWRASTIYRTYRWLRPEPKASVFNDSYDMRQYSEGLYSPQSSTVTPKTSTQPLTSAYRAPAQPSPAVRQPYDSYYQPQQQEYSPYGARSTQQDPSSYRY
ncbi:hypothetical protein HKX48_000653 [Thoreauomyces humboldtii]|nr:hypothetical protein HKX48_000653 [Thoreauomyces humboldtii]